MNIPLTLAELIGGMHRRTCPLYTISERRQFHVAGTAIPCFDGVRHWLVTAQHVGGSRNEQTPLILFGFKGPHALRGNRMSWDAARTPPVDVDLMVIELEADIADDLERVHDFTDLSTIAATREPHPRIHYIVSGYPHSRNRYKPIRRVIDPKATSLINGDIQGVEAFADGGKKAEFHFAIRLPLAEVRTVNGHPFRVPKMQGMSGGGVWRFDLDRGTGLATNLSLVGVAIEYHSRAELLIATRIQWAEPLIHDLAALAIARQTTRETK